MVTASAISICHGARVEEQSNSSSRVQRHLTGRRAFNASTARDRLGDGIDLAAKAATDRAADELQLAHRHAEMAAVMSIE